MIENSTVIKQHLPRLLSFFQECGKYLLVSQRKDIRFVLPGSSQQTSLLAKNDILNIAYKIFHFRKSLFLEN